MRMAPPPRLDASPIIGSWRQRTGRADTVAWIDSRARLCQPGTVTPREYLADGITVLWDSEKCIHSGHCAATLPSVFRPEQRPWIDVEGATAEEIRRTIEGCPSGALGYRLPADSLDDAAEEAAEEEEVVAEAMGIVEQSAAEVATVTVEADGPLFVDGPIRIVAADGTVIMEMDRTWLCRCGHSAKKPFCDGSHRRNGFSDPGVPSAT